jgi:hypothetical protein
VRGADDTEEEEEEYLPMWTTGLNGTRSGKVHPLFFCATALLSFRIGRVNRMVGRLLALCELIQMVLEQTWLHLGVGGEDRLLLCSQILETLDQ